MPEMLPELRHSWRRLRRSPGFFLAATAMLSLGLGLAIFMFGGIKAYFLVDLPYSQPQQLIHIELQDPATRQNSIEVPQPVYYQWQEQPLPVRDLAAFHIGTVNLSGDQRPERFDGAFVSPNAFRVLGASPLMGRDFATTDNTAGGEALVVISHALWLNRFLGAPDIIGREIRVNAEPATIIGVMPEGFAFPYNQDIWLPLRREPGAVNNFEAPTLEVFARLEADGSVDAVHASLAAALDNMENDLPERMRGWLPMVKSYADEFVGETSKRIVATLSVCVLFVLFIACVNVASLMVARGLRFQRETAIRGALGASRWRLAGGVLAEAVLISGIAAAIGLLMAHAGTEWLNRYFASVDDLPPYWVDMSFDWRVGLFTVGICFLVALIAGLSPALRAGRASLVNDLKEGGGTSGGRASRTIRVLVSAEIALSCILLVATGLMFRSAVNLMNVETGANTENVLTGRLGLFETAYPDIESRRNFLDRLQAELEAIPGAEGVAIATGMPAAIAGATNIRPEGVENPGEVFQGTWSRYVAVTPEYFELFEIPLHRGRVFESPDDADSRQVAVITQEFAEEYFPQQDPVGKRVWIETESRWVTVVGVSGNVVHDDDDFEYGELPLIYRPVAQTDYRFYSLAVKTAGNPHALQDRVRAAVQKVDPDMPVYWLRTLDEWKRIGMSGQRLLSALLGIYAVFAVLLAGAGLYAVMAYAVNQRTREIGVRRALGADNLRIVHLFLRENAVQLGIALLLGLVLAAGFSRLLASEFVGVSSLDPLTYGFVLLLLVILIVAASFVPARRALRIQPQQALRYE